MNNENELSKSQISAFEFGEACDAICKAHGGCCYNSKAPEEKCLLFTKGQGCLKPKAYKKTIAIAQKWREEHANDGEADG